ncbi:hypothetical protein PHYC_03504 [Phycisphaerales bacterium]|nr:hypothetical protein PHYC_03504 [Phycisphaerales bacterium]
MGHEYQDRCSLEFGRIIAAGLPDHPEWLQLAKDNLVRWSERNPDAPGLLRCYREWLEILEQPLKEICEILTAETDEGQRLRQNSPFAGAIHYKTVWQIKKRLRHDANPT